MHSNPVQAKCAGLVFSLESHWMIWKNVTVLHAESLISGILKDGILTVTGATQTEKGSCRVCHMTICIPKYSRCDNLIHAFQRFAIGMFSGSTSGTREQKVADRRRKGENASSLFIM